MVTPVTTPVTAPTITVQKAKDILNGQENQVAKLASTYKLSIAFIKFLGFFGIYKSTNAAIKNAEQLDNLPKEIRSTVEKVIKAAAGEHIALKHVKDGSAPLKPKQKIETTVLLKAVTNLTGKLEQLTAARAVAELGDNEAETVKTFVQAVGEMLVDTAKATPNVVVAEDFLNGLKDHYVPNRALKAFNIKFAQQGVANITEKSLAEHVGKMTAAFKGITEPKVLFKVLKQLAVAITPASITAHINAHDDTAVAAEATKRQAEVNAASDAQQAPEKAKVAEAIARINVLRGTTGFNGEIDALRLTYLKSLHDYILKLDGVTKAADGRTAGLSPEQLTTLAGFSTDDSFKAVDAQKVLEGLSKATGNRSVHAEDSATSDPAVLAAKAIRDEALTAFLSANEEYKTLAGSGFNPEENVEKNAAGEVVRYTNVEADSVIGKAQAAIAKAQAAQAAAVAGIPAAVAAEFAEIVGFAKKLEAALKTTRDTVTGLKTNPAETAFLTSFADAIKTIMA